MASEQIDILKAIYATKISAQIYISKNRCNFPVFDRMIIYLH